MEFEAFFQDLRYGARMLLKKPGFTVVAVATLALGIGANTAIFSVVNATLLTPIPVPSPDRVALLWTENPARDFHHFPASVPDFLDWKASGIFSQLAAFNNDGLNVRYGSRTERLEGLLVTPEWFAIQGLKPVVGRTFSREEGASKQSNVVVLGWDAWNKFFQADASAVGKALIVNGAPHTVIGVLPKTAARFEHEELYVPAVWEGTAANDRGSRSWLAVGRIAPGLSWAAAQQRLNALTARLARQYPNDDAGQTGVLQPIEESYVEDVKPLLLVLFGAVGFVLLVACANIANLLLVRGTARRKEIAIRVAVGATRARITGQLLAEAVLLALLGALCGIVPAVAGISLIPKLGTDLPNAELIRLNGPVLLFAVGLALVTGVLFGLLPALQFWKAEANQPLRQAERGQSSRKQNRLGSVFVVAEIAFTLILLTGAGLMLRSFVHLRNRNPGYQAKHVLTMNLALSAPQFADDKKQAAFLANALERLSGVAGIESVAITDSIPGGDNFHGRGLYFPDRPEPRKNDVPIVLTATVSPDYFRAMRIPIRAGRVFRQADLASAPLVVMIDDIAVKKFWPHESPVGKRIRLGHGEPLRTVVGVVSTVEQNAGLQAALGDVGQVYLPLAQAPRPSVSLIVRSRVDPASLIPTIRNTVTELDPDVPLYKVQTLEEVRAQGRASTRLGTVLLGLFGAIALLLASVGVFGVISYTVGQRLREFGIRAAVGASAWDLLKLSLGKGVLLVTVGAVVGLAGAVALTRLMGSLLTGVSASDPLTFGICTIVLLIVGLTASYVPARRASRVDPTIALKTE